MSTTSPTRRRTRTVAALIGAGVFTLGCSVGGDLVSYEDLPEDAQRYTLEVETDSVTTSWEYVSDQPADGDEPEAQPCMSDMLGEVSASDCRPEPLIFLKYDLGLALDDTVPANEVHQITVTGYYQERLSSPPEVTDLEVEVSFDDGASWQGADTETVGDGVFTAAVPPAGEPGDAVTLRVSAVDDQGNSVVQTMPGAYALR